MKVTVHVQVETEQTDMVHTKQILCFQRDELTAENLGLTLDEAKTLLANLQTQIAQIQTAQHIDTHRKCGKCGKTRPQKGLHELVFDTLFGKLRLESPRFYTCDCQPHDKKSESPLAGCLTERIAPELIYLQTKWAALMPYGVTVQRLEEVLPINANVATVHRRVQSAGQRIESELDDEKQVCAKAQTKQTLAKPVEIPSMSIGIDSCFVHRREIRMPKAGFLEVIVGKCITTTGEKRCFGFVKGYQTEPGRRVQQSIAALGLPENQPVTFLSDAEGTIRDLAADLSPDSEHILDWFHITKRITVMRQMAKGLPPLKGLKWILPNLKRLKWNLWHGNHAKAERRLNCLGFDLEQINFSIYPLVAKLLQAVDQCRTYILNNQRYMVNYGMRYHSGERISTGFAESAVNQVVSKRFVKKQQMRWSKKGAHLLLQVRVQVFNDEWLSTFERWHPNIPRVEENLKLAA